MTEPAFPITQSITIYAGLDFAMSFSPAADCAPAPLFAASSPYQVGDYATDAAGNIYLVVVAGTSAASAPSPWNTGTGERTTSGTVTFMRVGADRLIDTSGLSSARFKVRSAPGGTVLASGSNAEGRVQIGYDPPIWVANTAYTAGVRSVPVIPNGYVYQVETAGTSHATTEPTWPTTLGAIVTDGTVVWRCVASDANYLTNLRIALPSSYTGTLTGWSVAWWSLEIYDGFSYVGIAEGDARLVEKQAQV